MSGEDRTAPGSPANGYRAIAVRDGRTVPAWAVLALVCLGQFMVVLDVSIVNVALPSIQRDLGFSPSGLQWVVNAYTLAFAGFLLLGGRAADLFGRRRMFLLGLGLFTVASLAGGLAQNQGMLVTARALQGLGGAVLAPATLTILTTSFAEGRERARALGVWSAVAAGGGAAGALLGGILTDLVSWRWILFVNVPIGIVVVVAARTVLAESRADLGHRSLDVAGAVAVTGGLVALVYAIVRTETYGWIAWETFASLGVAAVLLGAFLAIETRAARAPLVPLRIFRSRAVTGANLFILLLFGAAFASWYFQTLFMQNVLGYSPLQAGLAFVPQTVMIAVGAQVSSRLVTRLGARTLLLIGPVVAAAGMLWLSRITPGSEYVGGLLGPGLLTALGFGLSVPAVTLAATSGIPVRDAGLASGLINTNRQVGASIGLAALATVAADRTAALLAASGTGAARVAAALTQGYARAFAVAVLVCLAAAAVAWLVLPSLQRSPARQPASAAEETLENGLQPVPEAESA
jgi:EmrB/QacA subfamily drug resistance transporter